MRHLGLLMLLSFVGCSDDADAREPADGGLDTPLDAQISLDAHTPLDAYAPPDATRDARVEIPGCTLDRAYSFSISNGGSTSHEHALEGSTLTLRARIPGAISQCDAPLGPCGDPTRVDAVDLKLALSADDVRDRFADSAIDGSYGRGNDPIVTSSLWILTIVRDDGKLLQIGGWDCPNDASLVGCRPIPANMRALRELLRTLAEERLVRFPEQPFSGACAELQGS